MRPIIIDPADRAAKFHPTRRVALSCLALAAAWFVSAAGAAGSLAQDGEYLTHVGDCGSCHTGGAQPFAGGVRLNTPFGYMLVPNITPDRETGIGRWSSADFYRALHSGLDRHGSYLYPTMPYVSYTRVTREDSDAIYAYLRTVPAVRKRVDVNHLKFPFDERWTMGAWRELYFTEATYAGRPEQSPAWNRGAYLVEGLGHCGECHTPRNMLGAVEADQAFKGADIEGWYALNLSENLVSGLGSWSVDDIAQYLKKGVMPGKSASVGPMAEVVHNSLGYLTAADARAMATYLKSLPPDTPLSSGRRGIDPARATSARLYIQYCIGCHQARGHGIPGAFPALVGNGVVSAADPIDIVNVVLRGIPVQHGRGAMPSFASSLDDGQIAGLANFLRTSWGNSAEPNASASMVGRVRSRVD